jgi:two-component system, OmpR family, response regulator
MRVLLVEDDTYLAQAVCGYLRSQSFAVDIAPTIQKAEQAMYAADYGVVLLDLSLPDGEGLSLIPRLFDMRDRPTIIAVTARDQTSDRIAGLDAGVDDYLVKPYDPDELLARLRAIERRRTSNLATVIRVGSLEIDLGRNLVRRAGIPLVLSQKEWALLRTLASRPDRIHPRETLQDALYGFEDETDSNTLEVFIFRLRKKIGREHIQTFRGMGYRLAFGGNKPW